MHQTMLKSGSSQLWIGRATSIAVVIFKKIKYGGTQSEKCPATLQRNLIIQPTSLPTDYRVQAGV